MPRTHVVVEGENLSKIAAAEGFRDFRKLYDAPENEELRKKRPNPNFIKPGDEVVIPDRKPVAAKVSPGSKLTVKKLPPAPMPDAVEIALTDLQNDPIPNLKVQIAGKNGKFEKTSDANGLVLLEDASLKVGDRVDVTRIFDDTEREIIDYSEFGKKGLEVNTSTQFQFPNKRAIINRIMAKHSVERRASWGARDPQQVIPQDWDFDMIVIHHSGNSGIKDPKGIQDLHMNKKDDPYDDVAYQFMVRPSGAIVEGRYLSLKGAANAAQNTGKIGIIVLGDFEHGIKAATLKEEVGNFFDFSNDVPTTLAIFAAKALAITLVAEFPKIKRLVGHRDLKADTECPGGELYRLLGDIRKGTGLSA